MQQTFGLDSILGNIEELHEKKDLESLIELSSKCQFLFSLMADLKKNGHKMLVFSMSKKMLNLIEEIINWNEDFKESYKYLRIDGDTEISSRDAIC